MGSPKFWILESSCSSIGEIGAAGAIVGATALAADGIACSSGASTSVSGTAASVGANGSVGNPRASLI